MLRRNFLLTPATAFALTRTLKIGHRQASLRLAGPALFRHAQRIPGLTGIEPQVHYQGQTLWDKATLQVYKNASADTGILIPSLSGVWEKGASLLQPAVAEATLRKSIASAEMLGARVILVASFRDNCPRMSDESSYGPVLAMLRKVAPVAASAGVTLGMETSLSPQDDGKLVDLVAHPNVKIYFDANNTEFYGHKGGSVAGIPLLGQRICQVHCKNEDRLLEEPGRVDWAATLHALQSIQYGGWYVFETQHSSAEQSIDATKRNIAFLTR